MKSAFVVSAIAAACLSTVAAAQMGPGMMQGHGMGQGMMQGQGMGAGMGGPGMGPGAMQHGPGPGDGMMGHHGMGRGMMGGDMMAGYSPRALEALNLTDEQRAKVTEIRRDLQRRNYALMGSARELRWQAQDAAKSAELDEAAARKRFDDGAAIRKQMFEARLDAHKRIQDVLTKEQRDQFRKSLRPGGPGPG